MLRFEPVPGASKTCCPTHSAMETIGISDKNQSNYKNIWRNRDSKPDLLLEKFLSSLHCRDHLFINKNSWQK